MSKTKYIVFDFDGTLADTIDLAIGIFNKIAHEYNLKQLEEVDKIALTTKKPKDLMKIYEVTQIKVVLLLLRIRKEMGMNLNDLKIVTDIKETLRELKQSGFRLGILTSNSKNNVGTFLENNGLIDIVDFIYSGKNLFGKDKVMKSMLDKENISKDEIIYVGDEVRDIEACKKVGIPIIAVSWGLNKREILESLKPDQIAHTPKELPDCIQKIEQSI
jgi:phosphoglycolate phosphatase